ncbi:MAG: hypothetical protein MUF44_14175 [Hydrogenophaga sp.]|nr:hypothetical protein [Hydrogenophaga sp.]
MNRTQTLTTPMVRTLGALSLALLAACGGGGGGADTPVNVAPGPTVTAATTNLCGVQIAPTSGPQLYEVSANQPLEINGFETRITRVTSAAGFPFDGAPVNLNLALEDLREASFQGFTPQGTLDSMGVEMGSRFAPGAVACVSTVSRAINVGTELSPSFLLSWASASLPSVPLSDLPAQAINGFEFLHNFSTTQANAVFRMSKTELADPAAVRICHIDNNAATTCRVPSVTQDTERWTFTLAINAPGVYIISAPREEVPLE